MIKIESKFRLLSPLQHGADITNSNIRLFRRRRVYLPASAQVTVQSSFATAEERRQAMIAILDLVYDSIDLARKQKSYGAWDEFAAKVRSCAMASDTPQTWFARICDQFGIEAVAGWSGIALLDRFNAQEFLTMLIDEMQYLIAYQRLFREQRKAAKTAETLFSPPPVAAQRPALTFTKKHEDVPYISGNSIRGILRRLVMLDFCNRIGIANDAVTGEGAKIPLETYHRLFTGGLITGSTADEDIEQREKYIKLVPMLGLLGAAIGDGTIQGSCVVGDADMCCKENGVGEQSYYKFMDIEFGTRMDTAKIQNTIALGDDTEGVPTQMLYYQEVVMKGTEFTCLFTLTNTKSEVLTSAFYHALSLLKEKGFLGGKSATGHGHVEFQYEIPANAAQAYLEYVEANKEAMFAFVTKPASAKAEKTDKKGKTAKEKVQKEELASEEQDA